MKKPSVFARKKRSSAVSAKNDGVGEMKPYLAGLKDSMFEIINEMVKDCWAEKTAKTEAEKEAAVNKLKAFVAMLFEPED